MNWVRKRRSWWVALALPGVLLRALIPVGFMPGATGMEICHGVAPVPAAFDGSYLHTDDGSSPTPSREHRKSCGFAMAASGLAPPGTPTDLALLLPATMSVAMPATAVDAPTPIARAQLPRGPPALS